MLLLEYKGEAEGFVHRSRGRFRLDEEEEDTGLPDEEIDSAGRCSVGQHELCASFSSRITYPA